jgi:methyl-accepting chemotaxis protein
LTAFVAVTACTILGTSYLLYRASALSRTLVAEAKANTEESFGLLNHLATVQGLTQKLVSERDPDVMESLLKASDAAKAEAEELVRENAVSERILRPPFVALLAANEEVKRLLLQGRVADAGQAFIEKSNAAFEVLLKAMQSYQDAATQQLDEEATRASFRAALIQAIIMVLVGASVLAIVGFGLILRRSIVNGLVHIVDMIKDVAEGEGDLTKRLEVSSHDELSDLARWFNVFLDKLHDIISRVAVNAEHVASATEALSSSAAAQAQGADNENAQTAQVATAMQEISATVQQVSESSNQAALAAREAVDTARHGGSIVEETLRRMHGIAESVSGTAEKMEELHKSSSRIGRIAGVIDDIADQTNLLALNAAIEAARAGQQGRGFAVVAAEVRKLAERTTMATKEIAQMIKAIQDETKVAVVAMKDGTSQVDEGVKTTTQAGDALKDLIQVSERVGEMVIRIATAATEQSSVSEEVNKNMVEIAKLVNDSAEEAQQSARACDNLAGLALDLKRTVGSFKLAAPEDESAAVRSSGGDSPELSDSF